MLGNKCIEFSMCHAHMNVFFLNQYSQPSLVFIDLESPRNLIPRIKVSVI